MQSIKTRVILGSNLLNTIFKIVLIIPVFLKILSMLEFYEETSGGGGPLSYSKVHEFYT